MYSCYSNAGGAWVEAAQLNDLRSYFTMTTVGQYIIVTGGIKG